MGVKSAVAPRKTMAERIRATTRRDECPAWHEKDYELARQIELFLDSECPEDAGRIGKVLKLDDQKIRGVEDVPSKIIANGGVSSISAATNTTR